MNSIHDARTHVYKVLRLVGVFPCVRMHNAVMNDAPEGSLCMTNCPTGGWMMGLLFLNVLEHINKNTPCGQGDAILVLLDNNNSNSTLGVALDGTKNGTVMCTFPHHCIHQLLPLDVAVMGPFKTKLAKKQRNWLFSNLRKTIAVFHHPSITGNESDLSCTHAKIAASFKKISVASCNNCVC